MPPNFGAGFNFIATPSSTSFQIPVKMDRMPLRTPVADTRNLHQQRHRVICPTSSIGSSSSPTDSPGPSPRMTATSPRASLDLAGQSFSPSDPEEFELPERQSAPQGAYKRIDNADNFEDNPGRSPPHRNHFKLSTIAADCCCILLPLSMLVFVMSLWGLHDQPYKVASLDYWDNGIRIMATAFPILFASITGRFLSSVCRWRMEKGASIGFLETLMGSRTVGSTLVTLFQLRFATLATSALVALWAVSPLGAQAFLRMLSTDLRINTQEIKLQYSGWNASAPITMRSPEEFQLDGQVIKTVYSALLISASAFRLKPTDIWGNIRIPAPSFEESTSGKTHWRPVPPKTEYPSLLGIPVNNTIPVGNTSFSLVSSHIDLQCSPVKVTTTVHDVHYFSGHDATANLPPNGTWSGSGCRANYTNNCSGAAWSLATDRFIGQYWHSFTRDPINYMKISPAVFGNQEVSVGNNKILFQAYISKFLKLGQFQHYDATCDVRQRYVETRINCTKSGISEQPTCAAVAQRPSQHSHPSGKISLLSFPVAFTEIAESLPLKLGSTSPNTGIPDFSLQYLFHPSGITTTFNDDDLEVPGKEFGLRLSQIINTYVGAWQLIIDATRGMTVRSHFPGSDETTGWNEWSEEHIQVSRAWNLTCAASCVLLFICGVAGVVIGHIAKGPDMLGCVTSSIRDSRHFEITAIETTMDSMDLARNMSGRRIRAGWISSGFEEERAVVYGIGAEGRCGGTV